MARPRKKLTIEEAMRIKVPVVYGLADCNGQVFYIGRTLNPRRRFSQYKSKDAHGNKKLAEKMKEDFHVRIFEYSPESISDSESKLIKEYSDSIVNVVGCDIDFSNRKELKPWFAGTGVRCPSDHIIKHLGGKKHFKALLDVRSKLSDADRSSFEVAVFRDMHELQQKVLARWFDSCKERLLESIESGC